MFRSIPKSVVRSVLVVAATFAALSAAAKADVQIDAQSDEWVKVNGMKFEVNTVLKRAWVMIEYYDQSCASPLESCSQKYSERVQVPGLAYDPSTETITYSEQGAQPVVCAYVKHHTFVSHWTTVESTNLCAVRGETAPAHDQSGVVIQGANELSVFFGARNN